MSYTSVSCYSLALWNVSFTYRYLRKCIRNLNPLLGAYSLYKTKLIPASGGATALLPFHFMSSHLFDMGKQRPTLFE